MEKLGKYTIVEKIGVGGFGVVYKGYDPHIKRHVAIKTCSVEDREARERFQREAEIAGGLQHRNIVTVYELGFEADTPYLVQEFLSGEDLDRKIKRNEFVPLPEKILWLVQIARGLEFAHARGIVHRDIKPANIRILDDGTAKILDFGIAKLAHQTSHLTQAGITLGTAAYLAPEQIRGEPVDARTDIFSFGILAYELLAHERPFRSAEISAIFYKILNERAAPLAPKIPDLPVELDWIVQRCLQKEPGRRYAPTTELVTALERLIQKRPIGEATQRTQPAPRSAPPSAPPTPPPTARTAARRPDLDELEFRHADSPRVQSRSMATTAFGSGRPRGVGRWIAALAAAVVLAGVAIVLGRGAGSTAPDPEGPAAVPQAAPTAAASAAPAPAAPTPSAPAPAAPGADSGPAAATPAPAPAPPPEPEPEPEPGRVVIAAAWDPAMQVRVAGQRLRLDRQRTIELPAGSHTLQFRLETPAYSFEKSVKVRLDEGETERLAVPIERPGRLSVQPHLETRPGTVRLDGALLGPSPIRGRWLAPGEHFVEVFADGATTPPVTQTVTVRSGFETVVTFDVDGRQPTQVRERPADGA
jgi:serine/threonine-protein kinase